MESMEVHTTLTSSTSIGETEMNTDEIRDYFAAGYISSFDNQLTAKQAEQVFDKWLSTIQDTEEQKPANLAESLRKEIEDSYNQAVDNLYGEVVEQCHSAARQGEDNCAFHAKGYAERIIFDVIERLHENGLCADYYEPKNAITVSWKVDYTPDATYTTPYDILNPNWPCQCPTFRNVPSGAGHSS